MYIAPELAPFHDPAGVWVIHRASPAIQTVVEATPTPIDRREVARQLASILGLVPLMVDPLVRNHVGCVLVRELRADLGEKLVVGLAQIGIEARAVLAADLAQPQFVGQAHHFAYTSGGITYNVHGEDSEIPVPWESMTMLAAGWVEMGSHERHLLANLFFGNRYLRLHSRHLPYAHLEERVRPGSVDNFRMVVEELVTHCPGININEGVRIMHGGAHLPPHPSYPSIAAFDEDHVGLLQLL